MRLAHKVSGILMSAQRGTPLISITKPVTIMLLTPMVIRRSRLPLMECMHMRIGVSGL
jgi:hypothetical protein